MSQLVKITGKNTGKDVSVTITASNGKVYNAADLFIMTHFQVKPKYTKQETKSIINDGQTFNSSTQHGYTVTMKGARYKNGLEDFETDFKNNSTAGNEVTYRLQYQVRRPGGQGVDSNLLVGGVPYDFDLGEYNADQDVMQSMSIDFVDSNPT